MAEMKVTQLAISEWNREGGKQLMRFKSRGLCSAIFSTESELTILEMTRLFSPINPFPFKFSTLIAPQDRPCAVFMRNIDFARVYETANVMEAQGLTLNPMILPYFSNEANNGGEVGASGEGVDSENDDGIRATIVDFDFLPQEPNIITLLSSYGVCQMWKKKPDGRSWSLLTSLDACFFKAFPTETERAAAGTIPNTFSSVKKLLNTVWITSFVWKEANSQTKEESVDEHIIFMTNAAGMIVALRFPNSRFDANEASICAMQQTSYGHISLMKSFNNFLLVGGVSGTIHLLAVEQQRADNKISLVERECLWSRKDSMNIRRVIVTWCEQLNAYYLVTAKAAHVIAFMLTSTGAIITNCTLYIGGAMISGLEHFKGNDYIASTMLGRVHHIELRHCPNNGDGDNTPQLKIENKTLDTDFGASQMQIIGLSKTPQNGIWHFLFCCFKHNIYHSKYSIQMAHHGIAKICKDSQVSVAVLDTINVKTFDAHLDQFVCMRIEIFNGQRHDDYKRFCNVERLLMPSQFDSHFLQQLQLKYNIIAAFVIWEISKMGHAAFETNYELKFLDHTIQIVYITCKLEQLFSILFAPNTKDYERKEITTTQTLSVQLMLMKVENLLNELTELATTADCMNETIQAVQRLARAKVKALYDTMPDYYRAQHEKYSEKCLYCDMQLDFDTQQCSNAQHYMRRCCITYLQVKPFNSSYCEACLTSAVADVAILKELFISPEDIRCTFCRFAFIK